MRKPTFVYDANRPIGVRALALLLERDWKPSLLLVPAPSRTDVAPQLRSLVPDVPVLEGKAFRSAAGLERVRATAPDYVLSVHFPYIVPPSVLAIPRIGTLNLHPAYLPYNRGWHTPSWAILDDTPYGATLHWMDEGVDTGDIAMRMRVDPRPDDTAHSLYQRVLEAELELFEKAIPAMLQRQLPRIPQANEGTAHTRKDLADRQRLELGENLPVVDVIRRLQALTTNDWQEAAYFEIDGRRYRVQVAIRPDHPQLEKPLRRARPRLVSDVG